jgi:hypothetical protein
MIANTKADKALQHFMMQSFGNASLLIEWLKLKTDS